MGLLEAAGNLALGISNQMYQRKMQQESWRREDTAVSRRVADLQSAGLNKVLAAGQGAQSSSPINVSAPQIDNTIGDKAQLAANLITARKNNARTDADIALANQKTMESRASTGYFASMAAKSAADVALAQSTQAAVDQDRLERLYNWSKAKDLGMRSDIKGGIAAEAQQLGQSVKKAIDDFGAPLGAAAQSFGGKVISGVKSVHSGLAGVIDKAISDVTAALDPSSVRTEAYLPDRSKMRRPAAKGSQE